MLTAPQTSSIDDDRDADRGREARLTRHGVKSVGSSEIVDAHGLTSAVDRGRETGDVERQAATGWERRWGRGQLRTGASNELRTMIVSGS